MDTDNKNGYVTVNGAVYTGPIFNTGLNPIFGVINNHHPASPIIDVKNASAEIPPEVDENWYRRMPEQLSELMARQVQEQERRMREQLDQERRQFTEATIKMGREQAALQAEREAFEKEKRRKSQGKHEDDDVTDTNTSTSISMGASQYSLKAISTRSPSTTGSKQLTMSINTASVDKSRERSSPIEEVGPPRANKYPRLDSSAVQQKNYLRRQDTTQPQPTRPTARDSRYPSVVSRGVEENLKPSALASQNRSGKMVSKMQLLQSVNAKFKATGAPSPTPTSTSSRSLVSVATKAVSAANTLRQQPVPSIITSLTRSTGSVVSSRNFSLTFSESSEGNSPGFTALANRTTSDKMMTALEKYVTVASATLEEPDKSRRLSSGPSKIPVLAMTTKRRRE